MRIYAFLKQKVTPGFSAVEYERRRSNLIKALPESSAVVCLGYGTRYMSNNIFYPYHQKTDFLYLCGFNEPDAALILGKKKKEKKEKKRRVRGSSLKDLLREFLLIENQRKTNQKKATNKRCLSYQRMQMKNCGMVHARV